jgi:methyl-accepting chemotaxis protein
MASAIEQQAVATKQVVGTVDSLLGGSREISSNSAQLAISADQMSGMSQQLLQLMERFHIPEPREQSLAASVRRPVRVLARQ